MHAKATFENGKTIETDINGSVDSVSNYYQVGRVFNLGSVGDNMQKLIALELYEDGLKIYQSA